MSRLAFLFSFMFILNAHAAEPFKWPVIAANVTALMAAYSKATPTATATATASGPQLVQQKTGSALIGPVTVAFDTNITAGNMVAVFVGYINPGGLSGNTINSVSTASDTYENSGLGENASGISVNIWYFASATGGEKEITVTQSFGLTEIAVVIAEFSPSWIIGNLENSFASSDNPTTNPITPTANGLALAITSFTSNSYLAGPTNSFIRGSHVGTGGVWIETAYQSPVDDSSLSTDWTLTDPADWATVIASFTHP